MISVSGNSGTSLSLLTDNVHETGSSPTKDRSLLTLGTRKSSIKILAFANTSKQLGNDNQGRVKDIIKRLLQRWRLL
jgi:hypothetical protein